MAAGRGGLALAFVLSALIGLEREFESQNAGLSHLYAGRFRVHPRHLVSKYRFTNVLAPDRVVLDPSRVAAQIVTGIGFIGGGQYLPPRQRSRPHNGGYSLVDGSVGMACGAGLPNSRSGRDGLSFRRGLRVSAVYGAAAEIAMGTVGAASVLPRWPRSLARSSDYVHAF